MFNLISCRLNHTLHKICSFASPVGQMSKKIQRKTSLNPYHRSRSSSTSPQSSADWPSNCPKTFPQISTLPQPMAKLTLNDPAKIVIRSGPLKVNKTYLIIL